MGDWTFDGDDRFDQPEDHFLSTRQAAAQAGITYRQADHWLRTGTVTSSGPAMPGSGHTRQWSEDDVVVLRILGRISRAFNGKIDGAVLKAAAGEARRLIATGLIGGDPVYIDLPEGVQIVVETDEHL